MAVTNREQKRQSVLNALNNNSYDWRTIPGITKEAHIDPEEAIEILGELRRRLGSSIKSTVARWKRAIYHS